MEIAYLAGLIDGEGTITLSKERAQSKMRRVVLSIQMCDESLIKEVQQHYGGTVTSRTPRKAHHSRSWTWAVTNENAIKLLKQLLPHLRLASKKTRCEYIVNVLAPTIIRNGKYSDEDLVKRVELENAFFRLTPTRMSPISPIVTV